MQQITLGRQATEQRVVSQDLEIWMSRLEAGEMRTEGTYNLVARAGRRVQEVKVTSTLSKEQMKAMIAAVLFQSPAE